MVCCIVSTEFCIVSTEFYTSLSAFRGQKKAITIRIEKHRIIKLVQMKRFCRASRPLSSVHLLCSL